VRAKSPPSLAVSARMEGAVALHTVLARDYLPAVIKDKKALVDRLKVRATLPLAAERATMPRACLIRPRCAARASLCSCGGVRTRCLATQTLAGVLKELEQTDEHELYAQTASALAGLRSHADEEVRLLVACCLADVLRIYAPEAPFDADVLHQVFRLFIAQLRGLKDGGAPRDRQRRLESLLEKLALVKAFVLLIELDLLTEITELFSALFDAIRAQHSIKIEAAMCAPRGERRDALARVSARSGRVHASGRVWQAGAHRGPPKEGGGGICFEHRPRPSALPCARRSLRS